MRKGLNLAVCLSCLVPFEIAIPLRAQQGQPAASPALPADSETTPIPHDPDALVQLAARLNNLTDDQAKPWRLKASYTVKDEKGAVAEQGEIEELWAGQHRFRTNYTVNGQSQTNYATDTGVFRTGSLAQPNPLALELERELTQPFPAQAYLQHTAFEARTQNVGTVKLNCLQPNRNAGAAGSETFCINLDRPVLRIHVTGSGARQAVRNQIVLFQGRYVAKEIHITAQDKSALSAQLETLATIAQVTDADFTPPPDARPLPRKIAISAGVAQGLLLHSNPPHYPQEAKTAGISGTVVIQAQIGKDGHIHDPEVVSGPAQLRQAALDAIKDWEYRPYVLNGETVEVETTINIIFRLSH